MSWLIGSVWIRNESIGNIIDVGKDIYMMRAESFRHVQGLEDRFFIVSKRISKNEFEKNLFLTTNSMNLKNFKISFQNKSSIENS